MLPDAGVKGSARSRVDSFVQPTTASRVSTLTRVVGNHPVVGRQAFSRSLNFPTLTPAPPFPVALWHLIVGLAFRRRLGRATTIRPAIASCLLCLPCLLCAGYSRDTRPFVPLRTTGMGIRSRCTHRFTQEPVPVRVTAEVNIILTLSSPHRNHLSLHCPSTASLAPLPLTALPNDHTASPPNPPIYHPHRSHRTMATAYKQFLPPRDFVGYGLDTPKGDIWPNGAKIAVSFVLNCEWCGGGSSVPTFSCYHHFYLLCPFPPGSDSLRIAV